MAKDDDRFTMFWTHLQRYEQCPQLFLWKKGWPGIDLGRGPGKKKYPKEPRSSHHSLMGSAIGGVIEDLYNQYLWKYPGQLKAELEDRIRKKFLLELNDPRRMIDWQQAPQQDEMLQVIRDGVFGYLRTMKHHKLIGPWAKSEYEMLAYIDKWTPIGGKADIAFRRPDDDPHLPGLTILDGKNGKKKENDWTSADQLRWYALCFYLSYGKMPDRLGFVYFRHPYGAPEVDPKTGKIIEGSDKIEQGVKWVPFQRDDLVALAKRAKEAKKGMFKHKFGANPQPKLCKYCEFEPECPERQAQKSANASKRKKKKKKKDPLDAKLDTMEVSEDGFYDLSKGGHKV